MKRPHGVCLGAIARRALAVLVIAAMAPVLPVFPVRAQAPDVRVPMGVYIDLSREFYNALGEDGEGPYRFYSSDPSQDYLRRIAVSSEFTVKTNLEILRRQDEIIRLLQTLVNRPALLPPPPVPPAPATSQPAPGK